MSISNRTNVRGAGGGKKLVSYNVKSSSSSWNYFYLKKYLGEELVDSITTQGSGWNTTYYTNEYFRIYAFNNNEIARIRFYTTAEVWVNGTHYSSGALLYDWNLSGNIDFTWEFSFTEP